MLIPDTQSAYSLSKLVGETIADQYVRWSPDLKILSYRFSNVIDVERMSERSSSERTEKHVGLIGLMWTAQSTRIGKRRNSSLIITVGGGTRSGTSMPEMEPRQFAKVWRRRSRAIGYTS